MKITRKLSDYIDKKYPNWDVSIALRYLPVIKKIEKLDLQDREILDVGSGEFGLGTYLKNDYKITGTDIDFGKERDKNFKIVKASAEKLPFGDDSFPVVISVDMLEHLPQNIRKKSIEELIRVADKSVVIAYPSGKLSKIIDKIISRYYKLTHKESLDYLNEHIEYGLPDDEVDNYIKQSAKKLNKEIVYKKEGNTNAFLWLFMLILGFSEVKILTYSYHKLLFFLPLLNKLHIWPTYRKLITIDIKR